MRKEGYKFSKEQLDKARETSLADYLLQDSNRFYEDEQGYIRDKQRPKFKVDRKRNKYFMNQDMEYAIGNPIEYVDHIMDYGFVRAVEELLNFVNDVKKQIPTRTSSSSESSPFSDEEFEYYLKMAEQDAEYQELYEEY